MRALSTGCIIPGTKPAFPAHLGLERTNSARRERIRVGAERSHRALTRLARTNSSRRRTKPPRPNSVGANELGRRERTQDRAERSHRANQWSCPEVNDAGRMKAFYQGMPDAHGKIGASGATQFVGIDRPQFAGADRTRLRSSRPNPILSVRPLRPQLSLLGADSGGAVRKDAFARMRPFSVREASDRRHTVDNRRRADEVRRPTGAA
jgi:hypothetical protein